MYDIQDQHAKPASHYEYVIQKQTPGIVKQQAHMYMRQLEGWCSEQKASLLVELILKDRPEKIVEIGVFGGKSLIPMACALRANGQGKIYGIDPWDSQASIEGVQNDANKSWWGSLDHGKIKLGLITKIAQFGLDQQIELIQSTSADASPIYDIDILHIDGNHSEPTSYFDVTKWVPFVKQGGWIIFDDMSWSENGVNTTGHAVAWLNANCIKFAEFSDSCQWGIWIKP